MSAMVTHRKLQEDLRLSEARFRLLVERAPDAILVYDADKNAIIEANCAAERLFATDREQLIGRSPAEFYTKEQPDGRPITETFARHNLMAQAGKELVFERWVRDAKGSEHECVVRLVDLPSVNRRLIRASMIDVTSRRQVEAQQRQLAGQLQQAQKLEAVGRLTGGLAHDFNNLLAVVLGDVEMLQEHLSRKDLKAFELTDSIINAADKGAKLIRSLLAFARRQPLAPQPVNVSQRIRDFIPLMRRTLGEDIDITANYISSSSIGLVDPYQLETALLNLALNSRDAMPGGGRIAIEVRSEAITLTKTAIFGDIVPGNYVVVSVSDTGSGIPAEDLKKVIEPFFTTKPVGAGSGLGLSSVYGFAKQSGGHLTIDSAIGVGTTVRLYLPSTKESESVAGASAQASAADAPPKGKERILMLEDDDLVRATVLKMLEGLGYSTICASSGSAALDILKSNKPIDLLFTDIVLPGGLTGVQVAQEARALLPGLKVLFTSGYNKEAVEQDGRLLSSVRWLEKPFKRLELARMLREALDGPSR